MTATDVVHLPDNFTWQECVDIYRAYRRRRGAHILCDCSAVTVWKTNHIAFLAGLLRQLDARKVAWSVNGVPPHVQRAIETLLYQKVSADSSRKRRRFTLNRLLTGTARLLKKVTMVRYLLQDIVFWTINGPWMRRGFRYSRTLYEITERGVHSLPIVALVAGIMGLILAMQAAAQLRNFGAHIYIADLVGISVVRELGPLLAAVLVAGRSGSAIAAEIGSMVSTEEMDALRAMGVSVTKYVVVPKFVALLIVLPCLALFANFIGIAGGYAFGVFQLGIPSAAYIERTVQAIGMHDVIIGLTKSAADAVIIAAVATYFGITTTGGAEGIGKATTKSVVYSIVYIAIAHLFFTILFYLTGKTMTI